MGLYKISAPWPYSQGKECDLTAMKEKNKELNWEDLSPDDRMKYEIAEELGLLEKVRTEGWKSLSAKETGRIGGLMTRKKREQKKNAG